MKIIEELYCGGINLCGAAGKPLALREKLRALTAMNDQRMLAVLTDEKTEQFKKCREAVDELSDLAEREAFANGFCFAMKITAGVMETMRVPDIDE